MTMEKDEKLVVTNVEVPEVKELKEMNAESVFAANSGSFDSNGTIPGGSDCSHDYGYTDMGSGWSTGW